MSRVSVCHNLYVDTRKRKKEIVKLIKSLFIVISLMYVNKIDIVSHSAISFNRAVQCKVSKLP